MACRDEFSYATSHACPEFTSRSAYRLMVSPQRSQRSQRGDGEEETGSRFHLFSPSPLLLFALLASWRFRLYGWVRLFDERCKCLAGVAEDSQSDAAEGRQD